MAPVVDVDGLLARAEERLRLRWSSTTADPPRLVLPKGGAAVLAGPGVLRDGCVEGLRAFARAANLPVANTWGAKGVFAWDDPHHMGTCGLQAQDFELLGFGDVELIVATGIDPTESPRERFALAPVVEVEPGALAALAESVPPSPHSWGTNELHARLAAIAQPGYLDDRFPRHPARAVMDLRRQLPDGWMVTADPGPAGLWVARTFPTTEPGSVVVPAWSEPGVAAALALVANLRGQPAVAVTTEPIDAATTAVLDRADDLFVRFDLVAWGDDVDLSLTRLLIEAAGPVVAWAPS